MKKGIYRLGHLESNLGEFRRKELGHGSRQLSEGFTHKKTSITTNDCRHGSRMEWAKNGTDIDSAYGKASRSWVKLNVTIEEESRQEGKVCTGAKDVDEQR